MRSNNKTKRKNKKMGLNEYGMKWEDAANVWEEEPFLFDDKRPFYGRCGICKNETTDTPYIDDGTEGILFSLLGQMDVVRYITRLVYEDKIKAIHFDACDRYPYYYCSFCKCNYLLCMNSLKSEYIDHIPTCQTISSCRRMDIPFFIDADDNVDEKIHDIFSNSESDERRLEMYWELDLLKTDPNTFWKHRNGEFYPVTVGEFDVLKPNSAFYFIGECYMCNKTCTGTVFAKSK